MSGTTDHNDEEMGSGWRGYCGIVPSDSALPAGVVRALTVARRVEAQARGAQRPIARAATGRLMAVIAEAGWTSAAMAPAVGLTPSAVTWRIRSARRAGLPPLGVVVPSAPRRVPLRIDEKPWLTPGEAVELMGVHRTTLHRWRRNGLMPNAARTAGGREWRYCRDDLAAIIRRRGGRRTLPPGQQHSDQGEARVLDVPRQLANRRRAVCR